MAAIANSSLSWQRDESKRSRGRFSGRGCRLLPILRSNSIQAPLRSTAATTSHSLAHHQNCKLPVLARDRSALAGEEQSPRGSRMILAVCFRIEE
jgi:hypothetical protein